MDDIYHKVNDKIVLGKSLPVLTPDRVNENWYMLTKLEVYEDGQIICWGAGGKMSLNELIRAIEMKKIVMTVPEGATIFVHDLSVFTVQQSDNFLRIEGRDLIAAVQDALHQLNNEPDSSHLCVRAFLSFLQEPSPENREQLRQTYEAVPSHWRRSLLNDPDNGDSPISAILARDINDIDMEWLEEQKQVYLCKVTLDESIGDLDDHPL
jgi:hypothetical protein